MTKPLKYGHCCFVLFKIFGLTYMYMQMLPINVKTAYKSLTETYIFSNR